MDNPTLDDAEINKPSLSAEDWECFNFDWKDLPLGIIPDSIIDDYNYSDW